MTIKTLAPVLIGHTNHPAGDLVEVADSIGHRHIAAGTAALAVRLDETADLDPIASAENAENGPGRTRKRV